MGGGGDGGMMMDGGGSGDPHPPTENDRLLVHEAVRANNCPMWKQIEAGRAELVENVFRQPGKDCCAGLRIPASVLLSLLAFCLPQKASSKLKLTSPLENSTGLIISGKTHRAVPLNVVPNNILIIWEFPPECFTTRTP